MNSIFHRVSVRKYLEKPVEEEKIELLMRAAMAAPSACNQQPWEFYVITDKEVIGRISACSKYAGFTKDAAVTVVPCFRKVTYAPEYALIDLSASVENLLLEADHLGLGATWCAAAPDPERMAKVREVLEMPEALEPFAIVGIGYPAEERPQQDRYDAKRVHRI
jgi:nitroreductase